MDIVDCGTDPYTRHTTDTCQIFDYKSQIQPLPYTYPTFLWRTLIVVAVRRSWKARKAVSDIPGLVINRFKIAVKNINYLYPHGLILKYLPGSP